MRLRLSHSVLFGTSFVLSLALSDLRDAEACGGCFHPPPNAIVSGTETTSSVVTDHRMVFKVSANETILWDQVRYTGAPEEFAWVLPVRAGAQVELSRDEFIASLDTATRTKVKGPTRTCYPAGGGQAVNYGSDQGGGGGCGGDDSSAFSSAAPRSDSNAAGGAFDADAGTEAVSIVSQAVIGPYQAVTLHANNGEGVSDWLTKNKFVIPDNVKPTIDAYTKEGFDFIALRLRPGQGVQAMRPVRVVSPGADTSLPLRMVAAGIGAKVGLTLWIIGEGRYEAQNFPNDTVDDSRLTWDAKVARSNLSTLETEILTRGSQNTWLTEVSAPQQLTASSFTPSSILNGTTASVYASYMQQCITNPPRKKPCAEDKLPAQDSPPPPPPNDAGADAGDAGSESDAGPGPSDAGTSTSTCTVLVSGCDGYDDLEVASRGLHNGDIWVTRVRADLPVAALSTDFRIQATSQLQLSGTHSANVYADPNDEPCPNGVLKSSSTSSSGNNATPPPADNSACTCRSSQPLSKSTGTYALIGLTAFIASRLTRRKKR